MKRKDNRFVLTIKSKKDGWKIQGGNNKKESKKDK